MSVQLAIKFPEDWTFLPMAGGESTIEDIIAPLDGSEGDLDTVRDFLAAVLARLRAGNVAAFAAFAHADDNPPSFVQATCLVAVDALDPTDENPYEALAAASPFEGMDVETIEFHGAKGIGVRAVTYRRATELADETGAWPYVLEARYALPGSGQAALLLHFESYTILYADGLLRLFDAIAESAVVTL